MKVCHKDPEHKLNSQAGKDYLLQLLVSDLALVTLAKTSHRRKEIEQFAWVLLYGISLSTIVSLFTFASRDWSAPSALYCTKGHGFILAAWACLTQTTAAR